MEWSTLHGRINGLPLLLAGPILRQVTPTSVTVWVVLLKKATVKLSIYNGDDFVTAATRDTVAIGTNLHIVAVTARPTLLSEGIVYTYDLTFTGNGFNKGLNEAAGAAGVKPFAYAPLELPSFVLPPADPNALRLIHGSCRKPNGSGRDNLSLVDSLINQAVTSTNPLFRPHQLLLMGDQIYADDVADALLLMLTDAGDTLLGWPEPETLPAPVVTGGPFKATERPVYTRWRMLNDAGFTSEDLRSHLLSLGEYVSMYLFTWSDVLWPKPADLLPSFEQIANTVSAVRANFPANEWGTFWTKLHNNEKGIKDDNEVLDKFRTSLPKVRKALANVPCYMICDDHEVTDDWNMTRDFCKGLYGHDIGIRVAQNALVAYALCQHWGNVPEQFDKSAPGAAGTKLLGHLDNGNASTYADKSASICSLIGVHKYDNIVNRNPPAVFHDPLSLDYHFTVEGPGHQIIFTDTRTWRSFPHGGGEGGDLLPADQFKAQILNTPSLRTPPPFNVDRVLLVVLTTNTPETEFLRAATRHYVMSNTGARHPDIYESWEMLSVPFDRLLKTLTDKLPPKDSKHQHYGPIILLSGDVHYSFASRMVYEADERFEDDPLNPQTATAVFVQLVASSLKKQTKDTVQAHSHGYKFDKYHFFTPDHVQEGYVGWNVPKGAPAKVVGSEFVASILGPGTLFPRSVEYEHPTLCFTQAVPEAPRAFDLKQNPDYRYRLEYLAQSTKASSTSLGPVSLPPTTGGSPDARQQAIKNFKAGMDHLRQYNGDGGGGGDIVGLNNVCEITFEWGAGDNKYVNHQVRWWYETESTWDLLVATYRIKLDPKDFPDITPPVTP